MAEKRGDLRATPPTGKRAASLFTSAYGTASVQSVVQGVWEPDTPRGTRLADPPWVEGFVAGDKPTDERAAPPSHGVEQIGTLVEIIKTPDNYRVLIDGVPMAAVGNKFWLPRFREQTVNVPDPDKPSKTITRRAVAPVFVAMRIEDGATRPQSATVRVRQSVFDDGVEVLSPSTVAEHILQPYSVLDAAMDVVSLPYPACVTRPPSLWIVDNDAKRRWDVSYDADRRKRYRNIIWSSVIAFYGTRTGRAAVNSLFAAGGNKAKLAKPLFDWLIGTEDENPAKDLWRWAFLSNSPRGKRYYDLARSVLDFNQFPDANPPPNGELMKIPLGEAIDILHRIVETRAGGSMEKDRVVGLTPPELRLRSMRKDAAFLEWLLYGQEPKKRQLGIGRILDPFGFTATEMSGNVLDPQGMDPYLAASSRCEFSIDVNIVDDDGQTSYQFDTLRANGIDASFLMAGYDVMRQKFRDKAVRLIAKIEELRDAAPTSWMTSRTARDRFVFDTTVKGGSWWPFGGLASKRLKDAQQWQRYTKKEKKKKLAAFRMKGSDGSVVTPLLIDLDAVKRRLLDQIVGPDEEPLTSRQGRATLYRPNAAPADEKRPEGLPAPPKKAGLPKKDYDKFVRDSILLYKHTHGLPVWYPIEPSNKGMLRWRDLYSPLFSERYYLRMAWLVVPEPIANARRLPKDAIVRRLPQLATFSSKLSSQFGSTRALSTISVPQEALSDRTNAKAAVDAAREIWKLVAEDLKAMIWTIEPPGLTRGMHTLEISSQTTMPTDAPPLDQHWRRYLSISSTHSGTIPGSIAGRVFAFEQTPDSLLTAAADAAGSVRGGDAAVLMSHRLAPSVVSWRALQAMANAIAYEVLIRGPTFKLEYLASNAMQMTRQYAALAADIIDTAYGMNLKLQTLLSASDLLWVCVPGAGHAHAMLRWLGPYHDAQEKLDSSGRDYTLTEFGAQWPTMARKEATAFAKALRTLSRASKFDLRQWPFMALQTLIIQRSELPLKQLPYTVAKDGLDDQLQAATSSLLRVRRLLRRSQSDLVTNARMYCLFDVVTSRPVVMQAVGAERPFIIKGSLLGSQKDWGVPVPVDRSLHLRALMASRMPLVIDLVGKLRIDSANEVPLGDIAIGRAEDVSVLVPPCGLAEAGMLDLGNGSALEDQPVWLSALHDSLANLKIMNTFVTSLDTVSWTMKAYDNMHPFVLRLRVPYGCAVQGVDRIPQKGTGLDSLRSDKLPASLLEVCDAIRNSPSNTRISGLFSKRRRSLLWLVDRFLQLQLTAIGLREVTPTVHQVKLVVKDGTAEDCAFVAMALAIATSIRKTAYAWNGEVQLAVASEVSAVYAALKPAERMCIPHVDETERDPLKAVPLVELCHVLACELA